MAYQAPVNNQVYGLNVPLGQQNPQTVNAQRAPTVNDQGLPGQIWVNNLTSEYWVNCGVLNGQNMWTYTNSGGATFSSVTITGASGTVLTVDSGNTSLGGNLLVSGTSTFDNAFTVASANHGVGINSGTGSLGISTDASITTVQIATGSANKTFTAGSTSSGSTTTLQSSTGGLDIESNNGAINILSGTGVIAIASDSTVSSVEIGQAAAAKTIGIGNTISGTTISLATPATVYVVANQGYQLGTASGPSISFGAGAPSFAAAQGSLYIRTGGSGGSQLLYVNSTGSTTWLAFTAA